MEVDEEVISAALFDMNIEELTMLAAMEEESENQLVAGENNSAVEIQSAMVEITDIEEQPQVEAINEDILDEEFFRLHSIDTMNERDALVVEC